jgi:phospholipase A2
MEPERTKKSGNSIKTDIGTFVGAVIPRIGEWINGELPAIANNPHKHNKAFIEHNDGLSKGELTYLKNRLPIVKAALEKLLNRKLNDNQVPKIALIGSGGGYRAMLCTTGSLCGAEEIGLLDATTYITALSGSTWAVAPWISTGLPPKQFKEYIKQCAAKSFFDLTTEEKKLIANTMAVKKTFNQSRTLVDPYGDFLANRLLEKLGDLRQMIYLSEQSKAIASGIYPYPIYTAIDGREEIVKGQNWYEFTPHTICDRENNIHIPTWAFGRKFKHGMSTDYAPEKNLGYIMGTCGSAFAASINDIIQKQVKDPVLREKIEDLVPDNIEAERPINCYAKVPNYIYKMVDVNDAILPKEKHMKFVDAGLEFNLPYPPVSGICQKRAPEILIFLDASKGEHMGSQLKKVAEYAQKHNRPFPNIDVENIDKKTINIFKDENNKEAPIVIYMPAISDNNSSFDLHYETNHGFADTKNFQYTPEHSTLVMNQTEFNMLVNKDKIIETINWCIDRK